MEEAGVLEQMRFTEEGLGILNASRVAEGLEIPCGPESDDKCNEELQEETDDAPLGDDVSLSWAEFLSELGVEELETSTMRRFDFGVAGGPPLGSCNLLGGSLVNMQCV